MNSTHLITKEPIGAWVRKADDTFTRIIRKTSQGDFNRVDWQLLNSLHERNKLSKNEIVDFLGSFESKSNIETVIRRFEKDALVNLSHELVEITAKGREVFKEAFKAQEKIKEKSLQGISETDYITTISTIKKMLHNLTEFLPENSRTATGVAKVLDDQKIDFAN